MLEKSFIAASILTPIIITICVASLLIVCVASNNYYYIYNYTTKYYSDHKLLFSDKIELWVERFNETAFKIKVLVFNKSGFLYRDFYGLIKLLNYTNNTMKMYHGALIITPGTLTALYITKERLNEASKMAKEVNSVVKWYCAKYACARECMMKYKYYPDKYKQCISKCNISKKTILERERELQPIDDALSDLILGYMFVQGNYICEGRINYTIQTNYDGSTYTFSIDLLVRHERSTEEWFVKSVYSSSGWLLHKVYVYKSLWSDAKGHQYKRMITYYVKLVKTNNSMVNITSSIIEKNYTNINGEERTSTALKSVVVGASAVVMGALLVFLIRRVI